MQFLGNMSQSGYNIKDLVIEGQSRWLKPAEVLFILQNHENQMITQEPPQKPGSGSLFLFNKRVLRFFRKDGHSWRRKRDGRTVGEAHERLKVGNVEALNCYYAHGEQNPNFQRRSYWILNPAHEHIVLVHYRDINELHTRTNEGLISQFSPASSSTVSQGPISRNAQQPRSSAHIGESYDQFQNLSSTGSVESSDVFIKSNGMNFSEDIARTEDVTSSSSLEISQALRRLEEQLSLNDDSLEEIGKFDPENENSRDSENSIQGQAPSAPEQGYNIEGQPQLLRHEDWREMLDGCNSSEVVVPHVRHLDEFNGNGILPTEWTNEPVVEKDGSYTWLDFAGMNAQNASASISKVVEDMTYPAYLPDINDFMTNDNYTTLFDQGQIGCTLEDDLGLTIAQKQKFTIREISPEWVYASETTKVFIIGSFLCDPLESTWTCMFGDIEVPVQIIQEGVICCHAPSRMPGKVAICITSSNREACSEVREFEYRVKPTVCRHCSQPDTEATRSPDELLLLVRLVQLLLSNPLLHSGDTSESGLDLVGKSKAGEDSWGRVIDSLLVGTSTSSITTEWLLEKLLKDKLQNWLSSKPQEENNLSSCSLSRKEQGIIHIIAGLGLEWALHPILKSGVNVNFRDITGWTALHWAACFGREKMVAALIASGASAGAVTDPNPQEPTGKTAASIAAACGHKGLAGYLSEVALTSHLSSLTLEESELSKGSANVEAERTFNSISGACPTTNEDQLSLKDGLAAVRNAAQAAARIQSAFRAHSFRKRQQREAAAASNASASGDEYGILSNDIPRLSAASKMAFHNSRDYYLAALSIQKKYRGWKGRKDFLALRQKVVKIQAHVRGYQVRKYYRVCWAVSILEKLILRWRRRGVGLRGFRLETDAVDESEDEDILRVFRKQKVDPAIDEALSRVLSMVESPEARQQYRRILEKYRQAKAELDGAASEKASTSCNVSNMDNDDIY